MNTFKDIKLSNQLQYALDDLGFETPTPIQQEAFSMIRSGVNVVGISQTGTGKTLAYMLPILQGLKFSKQINPRVLVLVPTRELVLQMVEKIESYSTYVTMRVLGVYGGTNINTQAIAARKGCDVLVATPGRLYDLVLGNALKLKAIQQLVIDEVDVMLDLGFRFQLINIFELLPERRQNIMFSATMTDEVEALIDDFFVAPAKISIAVSGTPLDNIAQQCYAVPNFYTKVNLVANILKDKEKITKVLVFTSSKRMADRLFENLEEQFGNEMGIIHSNKSQNYRIRSIEDFDAGKTRILITTDVMARGLDLDKITDVINVDTPNFPENYMHRIGRTGRAEEEGRSLLFYTEKEITKKEAIETLMDYQIPLLELPEDVEISIQLTPEERENPKHKDHNRHIKLEDGGGAFHEKSAKNSKINQGGKYRRELAAKYKKPQRRGDKIQNLRKKKKKK